MTGSYKISLYDYLKSLSTVDKQLLMQNLQISSIDYPIVVQAAHRLYWDNLWPAKLRITGDNGKMLLENTTYTGLGLVESVNSLNPRLVLDIGCGQNFYKHKIKNLVGIDIFGKDCDLQFDYFSSDYDVKADVILMLGVLEYGSPDEVQQKLQRIKQNCQAKTQVFFRFNVSPKFMHDVMPGIDICYFMNKCLYLPEQWDQSIEQAGFQVVFSDWDTPGQRWHVMAKLQ
jgi:hypothetical protein